MILIVDSGSTKTQWTLLDGKGSDSNFFSVGFNPYFQTSTEIRLIIQETVLKELAPYLNKSGTNLHLHYYGAGCSTPEKIQTVRQALQHCFPKAVIHVNHDLLGAARALCGKQKGIACILGTGSNSCLYDGKEVVENVPSVGYLFGDFGSGAHFGKTLIQHFFNGELPADLQQEFSVLSEFQREYILDQVYNHSMPSRFLASYSKFVQEKIEHPFIKDMVKGCFSEFLKRQVETYTGFKSIEVNSVGSVGYFYKQILVEVIKERGLIPGKILQSPMEGLIQFHL